MVMTSSFSTCSSFVPAAVGDKDKSTSATGFPTAEALPDLESDTFAFVSNTHQYAKQADAAQQEQAVLIDPLEPNPIDYSSLAPRLTTDAPPALTPESIPSNNTSSSSTACFNQQRSSNPASQPAGPG